jgi:hypothetical protein
MHFMTTLAGMIVLASSLAAGGETPSPEAFLPSVGDKDAYTPTAAFGKDVFLVVWRSGHLAPGDLREQGLKFDAQLVGCRVDKSGKPLDAQPFVVSSAADLRDRPRLAFGGDVFLAVWQDLRNGKDWDVYAARISPDGKVLDPDGIPVGPGIYSQAMPDVAWDGKAFQVVWMDFRSGKRYEIYGARVSAEGKLVDAQPVRIAAGKMAEEQFKNPCVAATAEAGGKSMLYWNGGHLNRGNPLASCQFVADGKSSGEATFTEKDCNKPPGGKHPAFPAFLAAGAKEYFLTWTTNAGAGRGGPPNSANAAILDSEGKLKKMFSVSGMLPGPWHFPPPLRNPQATWDGKGFVAVWDQHWGEEVAGAPKRPLESVYAARVTPEGEAAPKFRISGEGNSPAIKPCAASDGAGTTLVAYERHPDKAEVPIRIGIRMLTAR